jgi:hypothetical protein
VQVAVGARHFHLDIGKSAHADINRRSIHAQHRTVADQDHIRFQHCFIGGYKFSKIGGANFFFPFDQELDVAGKCVGFGEDLQGFHMHIKLTLVVGGSSCIDFSVFDHGFERAAVP